MKTRQKGCTGCYRYGFNGKEKDTDGEWGSMTHYDYGFRIYNPAIGKFLSVDPLMKEYPWYTPYQFAGNMPIQAIDLDGLEPLVKDGVLVGYNVQKGQGPTHISLDINNPETQKEYGYTLINPINWKVLVAFNIDKLVNVFNGVGDPWDANNLNYRSGNIIPGDELRIINQIRPEPSVTNSPDPKKTKDTGGGLVKAAWDSPVVRAIVPDFPSIGVSYDAIVGAGVGGGLKLTWVTHGPEASFYPILSSTEKAGGGYSLGGTIDFGGAWHLGPARDIKRIMVSSDSKGGKHPTYWGSVAAAAGPKAGVSGSYDPRGSVIGLELNIGGGAPAGPLPGNVSGGVSNTQILYDFKLEKSKTP